MADTKLANRRFSSKTELDNLIKLHRKESPLPVELSDSKSTGLMCRVRSNSVTAWYVYKDGDGRKHRISIGEYPASTLDDIRKNRDDYAAMRGGKGGQYPHEFEAEKKRAEQEARAEAESASQRQRWTVENVARVYLEQVGEERSRKTERGYRSHFENYVYPAIGNKDVAAISDDDVIDLLEPIRKAGSYRQRNACRTTLLAFFSWLRDKERNRQIPHLHGIVNPVSNVRVLRKKDVSGWKDRSKEPLPANVLAAVTRTLYEKRSEPYEAALLLQLLTGQRATQTVEARWTDINLKARTWRPDTKNPNSKHVVHLSPQAMAILESRPTRTGRAFPRVHYRTCLDRLRQYAGEAGADLEDVGTHSLRKNALTAIRTELGYPVEVRMFIADHAQSDVLEAAYVKSDWSNKAADALDQWGAFVEGLARGNVVKLERPA